jgi:protein TonB
VISRVSDLVAQELHNKHEKSAIQHLKWPQYFLHAARQILYNLIQNNMKKTSMRVLSLFMMGAVTSVLLMVSCKGKDYKEEADATADSLRAVAMADSVAKAEAIKAEALAANPSVSTTVGGSFKPNPAKKRGKASVVYQLDKDYDIRYSTIPIEINSQGIYSRAEIKPTYPGGEKALARFIQDNINYPESAIDEGVEGTVEVVFAVDENGRVYTPYIKGSRAGYGLDEEATRVVSKMPTWNPGQIKGRNVKSYYSLPISFVIN